MKRTRRDLPYRLRVKRAQANLTLKEVSALLGGNPSIWILHRIETRKQRPTPAQVVLLKSFLRMPAAVVAAKVRAMEINKN
ncbi:MAG: helix-turn-helix transcriptional regulator [Deltaproteobacteria bacterium]|nr:helix-turn-helix transcriptional regulator [Deltaproteobacteria bacterium]